MLWPGGFLLKLWGRTLRIEISEEDRKAIERHDVPVAIVIWHNRLFLAAEIFRRHRTHRELVALISASGDGAWLTAFFSIVGMRAARGSSSRLGREAASALVDAMRAGYDIGVTPDGPRGPCYDVKPGVLIVARRVGAPLLLMGVEFTSCWRLRSWDRFVLPKPFSRIRLRCEQIGPEQLADRDGVLEHLRARMLAINPDQPRG